jgi:hypothetical protein
MGELRNAFSCKPLFKPVKLYPGDPCENNNKENKKKKGFNSSKICIFRRLVGAVYEKYDDEVYEITKHRICYL